MRANRQPCRMFFCACRSQLIQNNQFPAASWCKHCGIILNSASRSNECCGEAFCKQLEMYAAHKRTHEQFNVRREKVWNELCEKIEEGFDGQLPPSVHVIPLPYNEAPLTPLPATRKADFENFLLQLTEQTSNENADLPEVNPEAVHSERFRVLNSQACSTCGGKCCQAGGGSAFLDATKLRQVQTVMGLESLRDTVAIISVIFQIRVMKTHASSMESQVVVCRRICERTSAIVFFARVSVRCFT